MSRSPLGCGLNRSSFGSHSVLIDGEEGRFVCADGRKPAVLKFSGKARKAVAYRLDPLTAAKLGIRSYGFR
jgi:hypothetical protein